MKTSCNRSRNKSSRTLATTDVMCAAHAQMTCPPHACVCESVLRACDFVPRFGGEGGERKPGILCT